MESSVSVRALNELKSNMRTILKSDPYFTWRDALAVLVMNWRLEIYPESDPSSPISIPEMTEYLCGIDIPWDKIDEILEEYYG